MDAIGPPRAARQADADGVGRLLSRSYPALMAEAYAPGILDVALPLMTRAHPGLLASGRFGLIEGPDGPIGCGGWSREALGSGEITPGLGHIRHFAVDPIHLGAGHGRSLYAWCARGARTEGIARFLCYASLNAEGFYAALGFERVEATSVMLAGTTAFPVVLMRASL